VPFLSSFPARLISLTTLAVAALAFTGAARAQTTLAPPAQSHVAAIGAAPLRAPATADFAPGGSLTLEGWFYLTANTPYAWLMGKGLATSGTDPFVSFALQLNSDGTKLAFLTSNGVAGSSRSSSQTGHVALEGESLLGRRKAAGARLRFTPTSSTAAATG
jgi:hypothetical protein